MAIDFLILCLLIFSFVVNLLALGAFWITPGLRTTANRFTINLLVVNLVGCVILAPTLFLCSDGGAQASLHAAPVVSDDSIEYYTKPGNQQMTIRHNGHIVEQEGLIVRHNVSEEAPAAEETIETLYKRNATFFEQLTIDERANEIVITEFEEADAQPSLTPVMRDTDAEAPEHVLLPAGGVGIRCWSIDLVAALGALAVLLVVGDTWCAVTDPLRYHTRISGVRTWIFIALIWTVGVFFGALSALRELDFESETLFSKQKRFIAAYSLTHFGPAFAANGIFGMVFACVYFVVIILLPFGFVCGMYWRIFSEARENGLRMRQNGSSPLLQSALNLTHHQQSAALQYAGGLCAHRNSVSSTSSHGGCGGLQLQIDRLPNQSPAHVRRDSAAKVLLPTISDDGLSEEASSPAAECAIAPLVPLPELATPSPPPPAPSHMLGERIHNNNNILLTLQSASGEIKRNYSARQLPLLGTSSQDLRETNRLQGIRQVHSSPNLQRYAQLRQDSLADDACSPHLLGHQHHQQQLTHAQRFHQLHHNHQHHRSLPQGHPHPLPALSSCHSHALQIPAIHGSPKALSYMSSLRHRLSNASSLFKYREESRAARISILVVVMFLVSYLPYGFLVLLQSRISAATFPHSTQLAIFMILLGTLTSPVIFAYRNKRVRRGVKRLFGRESRCRERSLHRNGSSLKNGSSGGGGGATIKRNSSKVSTYSTNSCKYLTPQSSLISNGPPASVHTLSIRPQHTLISFGAPLKSAAANASASVAVSGAMDGDAAELATDGAVVPATQQQRVRPILQRGITIVEQIPLGNKFSARHNLFKMFFQSSKSLSCAAAQSCAQAGGCDVKPADV